MTDSTQLSESKVSKATDNSKMNLINDYQNSNLPKSFIQYLLDKGMNIAHVINDLQLLRLLNDRFGIEFIGSRMKCIEFSNADEEIQPVILDIEIPNTLDQFKMIIACAGIYKLPINYKSDEKKVIEMYAELNTSISIAETLLSGADNAENFNKINAALTSLNKLKATYDIIINK